MTALSDWGVRDATAIRSGLISLIHEPAGPRLVVYKLSSEERPRFEPSTRGSTPSFQDNTLLVHGPGDGNRNRLGGFFNVFYKSPSRSEATLAASPDGRQSLRLSVLRASEGFCGMWIHLFDFSQPPDAREYLDAAPFEVLSFWVRGETGDEEVLLKIADARWELKGDALAIGRVGDFLPAGRIETEWQRAVIPLDRLDGGLDRMGLASLVFEGTAEGEATVYIRQVALSATASAAPPLGEPESVPEDERRTPAEIPRAPWVWNTTALLDDAEAQTDLVRLLEEQGIERVFLQLPGLPGETGRLGVEPWDEVGLGELVKTLRQAGRTVYALDGFRSYALKKHHQTVLDVVDRVIEHNRASPPEARFAGVHHDIEPYLLPGFHGTRRGQILVDYLDLVAQSARRLRGADLAYGVDIPFWYDAPDEDTFEPVEVEFRGGLKPVSEHVIDLVDEVTIMDYRTTAYGADGTIRHARGELDYAASVGKTLWIGLETFGLPDEDLLYIEGGPNQGPFPSAGEYIVAETMGDSTRLTLETVPESGAGAPPGTWWQVSRRVPVPADKITFARLGVEALERTLEETMLEFAYSPALGGFAIHFDESLRRLLACRTPEKCGEDSRAP
jgi:hypothetical protein